MGGVTTGGGSGADSGMGGGVGVLATGSTGSGATTGLGSAMGVTAATGGGAGGRTLGRGGGVGAMTGGGGFGASACSVTVSELIRVLAYPKFKLSAMEQHELLADYLPHCTTVKLPTRLPKTIKCRDVNDLPFLHLAQVGKADFLLSGDADLLSLADTFTCPIVTAEEFIRRCPASATSSDKGQSIKDRR